MPFTFGSTTGVRGGWQQASGPQATPLLGICFGGFGELQNHNPLTWSRSGSRSTFFPRIRCVLSAVGMGWLTYFYEPLA
jgi:hypothetical protein